MNAEFNNYLKKCKQPSFLISAISSLSVKIAWFFLVKATRGNSHIFLPESVRLQKNRFLSISVPIPVDKVYGGPVSECRMVLTGRTFLFNTSDDWNKDFQDEEVTTSLHRWKWLMESLANPEYSIDCDVALNLMRSWIENCMKDARYSSDAYSVGERIVNAGIYLYFRNGGNIPEDIKAAIGVMGGQVATHLEYYRPGQTGNHAFNNARALLFTGVFASLPVAVDIAYAIALERLPNLVSEDGFMREGSSHYHFLFTRWVLEMLWISKVHQCQKFIQLLEPYATSLVEKCWFFLVRSESTSQWSIPLIGDISPDYSPEWLVSLPWSKLACEYWSPEKLPEAPNDLGWANLFGILSAKDKFRSPAQTIFPSSGWYRFDCFGWTLIFRAESFSGKLATTHKHHDLCSFVLFLKGEVLLLDCGRVDYTKSGLSNYGKSWRSHNSLCIDGLSPSADGATWFSSIYSACHVEVTMTNGNDFLEVALVHDGFARLATGTCLHRRVFTLRDNSFEIRDDFNISSPIIANIIFHFEKGQNFNLETDSTFIAADKSKYFKPDHYASVSSIVNGRDPPFGGIYSRAYGELEPCQTLEFKYELNSSRVIRHSIVLES